MWDLTVPGNNDHDFYVLTTAGASQRAYGAEAGGTPVLVHNDSCAEGDVFAIEHLPALSIAVFVQYEKVFETAALACGKTGILPLLCTINLKNS